MDKKQLTAITDGLVKKVAEANGLTEQEARALVGINIRNLGDTIVNACTVAKPAAVAA